MYIDEKGSELLFGDFDSSNCFHIEASDEYKRIKSYYSSVEFILFKPEKSSLLFVEAKRTLSDINNTIDFNKNIEDIARKFFDSFQLACSLWIKNDNTSGNLPLNYHNFFGKRIEYKLVLVIKNRTAESLNTISDAIKQKLKKEMRIWDFKVITLNEEYAKRLKLVVNDEVIS